MKNHDDVIETLNKLITSVGLQKLAADDPGTSSPAKQEDDRSNIQSATTGSRSAENTADVKKDVIGTSVDAAKAGITEKTPAKSDVEKLTTATETGKNVPTAGDRKSTSNLPPTSHPADPSKDPEKYGAAVQSAADFVLHEIALLKQASVSDAVEITEDNVIEKLAELLCDDQKLEKTAEIKKQASDETIKMFLSGLIKSSSLLGELTADYLDGMRLGIKKADDEEKKEKPEGEETPADETAEPPVAQEGEVAAGTEVPQEAVPEGVPADVGAGAGAGAGGGDAMEDAASQIAQAAEMIAQQLSQQTGEQITADEVLEAAATEEGGEGVGAPGMEGAPGAGMEVAAQLKVLTDKANAFDKLVTHLSQEKNAAASKAELSKVVKDALNEFVQKHDNK